MKQTCCTLLLICFTVPFFAQQNNWYVQVGVFDKKVDIGYFNDIGGKISYAKDGYGFHRYYKGAYTSEAEATQISTQTKKAGYNSVVVAEETLGGRVCNCYKIPMPKSVLGSLQNIFFDFDQSYLRDESKSKLRALANILKEFPEYTTTLRAHTDAKGSNSYNEALSLRRANSAKEYLKGRGIAADRIKTETFGEVKPIAKNELNDGKDTEQGRQFNRRVEIIILDKYGNVLTEMVDEIDVPDDLEN